MTAHSDVPAAALRRWVESVPEVRCVAGAFRPWTGRSGGPPVAISRTSRERFDGVAFGNLIPSLRVVAGGGSQMTYWAGTVPAWHALALHAGSEAMEESFTAVIALPAAPAPLALPALAQPPRAGTLGIGSTRSAVQAVLGRAQAVTHACGDDVVRYDAYPQATSDASMWFFYRNDRVVAIARYEAV